MNTKIRLFTLHKSEEDFRIVAAILAEIPKEAASLWGGKYERLPDTCSRKFDKSGCCVTSHYPDFLDLCGTVLFHPDLFREPTRHEVGMLGWDSNPCYDRIPGLVIWNKRPPETVRLVMRHWPVYIHESVSSAIAFEGEQRLLDALKGS